jgi:deoxycytidine triphosphate deaminase
MILTGQAIRKEWERRRITIDPFIENNINPNSYNFRLDRTLRVYTETCLDTKKPNNSETITIPESGLILEPYKLYLANTVEVLGSDYYAPTYNARSSVARLGIFINLSATLCDIGFHGQITMQLYAVNFVKLYPNMNIGQIMFWKPMGKVSLYQGKYQNAAGPRTTEIYKDFEKKQEY